MAGFYFCKRGFFPRRIIDHSVFAGEFSGYGGYIASEAADGGQVLPIPELNYWRRL